MFSPDAKAAALLESYQVLAEEVRSLAEMEASNDIPDEDVARAITYIGRAMAELASARAFCVDLCEAPKSERVETRDRPDFLPVIGALTRGLRNAQESLCRVRWADGWKVKNPDWPQGDEPHLVREDEEEDDLFPVLNRPSPDRPIRFNAGGIYVWAKTQREAEKILADTRAALLSDEATEKAVNPEAEKEVEP